MTMMTHVGPSEYRLLSGFFPALQGRDAVKNPHYINLLNLSDVHLWTVFPVSMIYQHVDFKANS